MYKIISLQAMCLLIASCSSHNVAPSIRNPSGTGDVGSSTQQKPYAERPSSARECVFSKSIKDVSSAMGGSNLLTSAKAIYIMNEVQFMAQTQLGQTFNTLIGVKQSYGPPHFHTVPTTQTTHYETLDGKIITDLNQTDPQVAHHVVYTHTYAKTDAKIKQVFTVKHYQKVETDHFSTTKIVASFKFDYIAPIPVPMMPKADVEYLFRCPKN